MIAQRCTDIKVYRGSLNSAMTIFEASRQFPVNEGASLVEDIRRASCLVPIKIRLGFLKQKYPDVFISHLNEALGFLGETLACLNAAYQSGYLSQASYFELRENCKRIGGDICELIKSVESPELNLSEKISIRDFLRKIFGNLAFIKSRISLRYLTALLQGGSLFLPWRKFEERRIKQ